MALCNVGFAFFPNLTQLDFTGPQQVLDRPSDSAMHIVAKSLNPATSDSGLNLQRDAREAACRSGREPNHRRRCLQLSLEYDPHPPFVSGHPDRATAQTLAEVAPRYEERRVDFRNGIERLATA